MDGHQFGQLKNAIVLAAAYFPGAFAQVSSVLKGLTAEFGMGSGVAPSRNHQNNGVFYRHRRQNKGLKRQKCGKIKRLISTARLKPLLALHLRPIKVIIFDQPMKPNLGDSFALRCFQRLS